MKKSIRLVVVDNDLEVTSSIRKYVINKENIELNAIFSDGREALNYFIEYQNEYDAIVMDLLLPNYDAISILQTLRNRNIKKNVIILSSFKDDYSIKKLVNLGVDFYILKPFNLDCLFDRIKELSSDFEFNNSNAGRSNEVIISEILHDLGIPANLKGFHYIRDSILLILDSNNYVNFITKDIYPVIADLHKSTVARVERAIRNAIEISWERGNNDLINELFGNCISYDRGKPTNSEFLHTVADKIRLSNNLVVR